MESRGAVGMGVSDRASSFLLGIGGTLEKQMVVWRFGVRNGRGVGGIERVPVTMEGRLPSPNEETAGR